MLDCAFIINYSRPALSTVENEIICCNKLTFTHWSKGNLCFVLLDAATFCRKFTQQHHFYVQRIKKCLHCVLSLNI